MLSFINVHNSLHPIQGRGDTGAYPSCREGEGQGTPWTDRQTITGSITDTNNHTHTHSCEPMQTLGEHANFTEKGPDGILSGNPRSEILLLLLLLFQFDPWNYIRFHGWLRVFIRGKEYGRISSLFIISDQFLTKFLFSITVTIDRRHPLPSKIKKKSFAVAVELFLHIPSLYL